LFLGEAIANSLLAGASPMAGKEHETDLLHFSFKNKNYIYKEKYCTLP
jgi:hypothetical protein